MTAEELREMIDRYMYDNCTQEDKEYMATCAWQVFFQQRHGDSVDFPNYEDEGDDWDRAVYYMDTLNHIRDQFQQ